MNLTEHEQKLLLRALDKASAPAEAEKAAEALINLLRKRGVNGYEFLSASSPTPRPAPQAAPPPSSPRPPPPAPPRQQKAQNINSILSGYQPPKYQWWEYLVPQTLLELVRAIKSYYSGY
jgi:hypothetical protein